MDFTEKIFHYFVQKRQKEKQKSFESQAIAFQDFEKYAEVILQFFIKESTFEVRSNDQYVGLIGNSFVLPRHFLVHQNTNLNFDFLKYLIFYQCFLMQEKLETTDKNMSYQLRTVEALCLRPYIFSKFAIEYPATFQEFLKIEKEIDQSEFLIHSEKQMLNGLMGLDRQLTQSKKGQKIEIADCRDLFLEVKKKFKQNGQFRSSIWQIWGFLPEYPELWKNQGEGTQKSRKMTDQEETEVEKNDTLQIEQVDLEKEKKSGNPVTHSFEKLETADEYNGGYRMDSGDDELNDHQAALNELNLKKVTRGGESAQSIYRADLLPQLFFHKKDQKSQQQNKVTFPEWSYRENKYLEHYCQLEIKSELEVQEFNFKSTIEEKYRLQIDQWKKQIESLLHVKGWKNRQLDGSDIDLDSFIRAYVDIKLKQSVDQKIYMQKRNLSQDFAVSILLDQSMSSDSWVNNQRILDVCLDSLGIMGLLFAEIIGDFSVASTFSHGHRTCFLQNLKSREESWDHFYQRARQIQPQGYTRLGPGIRYCLQDLMKSTCSHRILILLTDGRPTDIDGYEGEYGIQDIHQAMIEAQQNNVRTFALTVDREAKAYFHKMFTHYEILQSPDQLSEKLFLYLSQILKSR